MHLREYLSKRGDLSDLARLLDLEPTTVRRWAMGRTPTLKFAAAIEAATRGAVPVSSWLAPSKKAAPRKRKSQRPAKGRAA
jgi:DNA-binding transcriptional regulator YdaS (Cro superfamily)